MLTALGTIQSDDLGGLLPNKVSLDPKKAAGYFSSPCSFVLEIKDGKLTLARQAPPAAPQLDARPWGPGRTRPGPQGQHHARTDAARQETAPVNSYLPFVVSGIATGSIYGLAATGLVLTYKTSGIFNFGHGAIATAAAYFFYYLHVQHGWDWVPAFIVAVCVAGPLLGLVMEPIARRLSSSERPPRSSARSG